MQEYSEAELTLRDLVDILKRHRWLLVGLPVVFGIFAVVYGFFIAKPTYASTATISVSPLQVQAQLERRIQVQQSPLLTFDGLRAIAFSEDVLQEVWGGLNQAGKLPDAWQDQGKLRGIERMSKAFAMKDQTGRQNLVPQGQVPPLVAAMTVKAEDPELAAEAANLWAGATIRRVNEIPLKRLRASLVALEAQIGPAEKAYREAQARWEEFNRTTTLAQDRAELDAKTKERVALDKELSDLERNLAAIEGRIRALSTEVQKQSKIILPDATPAQIAVTNQRLDAARTRLEEATRKAGQQFLAAGKALEDFRKRERIADWQAARQKTSARLASVMVRMSEVTTLLATKRAQLKVLEAQLAQQPRLLEVVREVVADPVVAQAIARSDLSALEGLRLKVQEVNPAYAPTLARYVGLLAEVRGLETEGEALAAEADKLESAIEELQAKIAVQEREKEQILLEYQTKKAAYKGLKARYDQLAELSASDLTFDNPNPEYQRLRSVLIDAEAERARLLARKEALLKRIDQVDARIAELKARVAQAQVEADQVNQALDLAKNTYLALTQKQTDLQIELASSQNALAQVVAPAYPIFEKVAPKRGLMLVLAVILGFFIAVFWAFIRAALEPEVPPKAAAGGS